MGQDIAEIAGDWAYDPNEVRARWIYAVDGSRKVQLRLDLGVLQMELEGRPDGTKPHQCESLLDFYLAEEKKRLHGLLRDSLDSEACAALQQEAMQYYYRIMACHALGDWKRVNRDSEHNLDLIDLAAEYAEDDEVAWQFSQLYPYMRMMNVRAQAEMAMTHRNYQKALKLANEAIEDIDSFFKENYEPSNKDGSTVPVPAELEAVRDLAAQIEQRRPRSEAETLQAELARAIELENYEKAALLRDRLKGLKGFGHLSRSGAKKRPRAGGGHGE